MSEAIRLPGSPFRSSNYRPRTIPARMQNGETLVMAKDKPANGTTPLITDPPKPTEPRSPVFGTKIEPAVVADFGDGKPVTADELDRAFPRDEQGQPISDVSVSPDTAQSPVAEPTADAVQPAAVLTGEPPHWWQDEGQRSKFEAFANSTLNDFDLMDRNERGELIEWTLTNYLVKRGLEPATFVTFTTARDKFYAVALNDFKDDLRAIAAEKGRPINTRGDLHAFIGYYTIEEALQKMVGKGIRAAICGKLAAIEAERHVAQVNGTAHREQPDATIAISNEPPPQQRNLPATRPQNGSTASALMTGNQQWDTRVMQAQMMLNSGLMPNGVDTIEKILTIGMMGEQLGIPMIVAVNNINVIGGVPAVKPQLMLAIIRRSGQLESLTITDENDTCTVTMKRKGFDAHSESFGMDDARRMMSKQYGRVISLAEKDNWKSQPATMRKWRALSAACRVVFPDHIWGLYTDEELNPDVIVAEDA